MSSPRAATHGGASRPDGPAGRIAGLVARLRAWRVGPFPVPDVLLAALCAAVTLGVVATGGRFGPPDVVWSVVVTLALAARRVRPLAANVIVIAIGPVIAATSDLTTPADIAAVFLLYSFGAYAGARVAAAVTGLAVLTGWGQIWLEYATGGSSRDDTVVAAAGLPLMAVPVGWGMAVASRRRREAALRAEAARQAEVARTAAHDAVVQERFRIARELHDVVAHHISGIVLRAAAAQRGSADDAAPEALGRIHESGSAALTAMRDVVGLLRDDASPPAPRPRLAALPALVAAAHADGLDVDLHVTGTPRGIPEDVELCVYRVVQEGLTNAARHAPGAAVRVTLAHSPDALEVSVVNEAVAGSDIERSPADCAGAGLGLVGMRERVAAVQGRLHAGPREDGGWCVRVTLPLPPDGGSAEE